nr:sulfotransferase domain-containing protein [Methylomarinum sp. Ch1-1]MDP4521194.1 sulfotransferase domain-containing protein [Methylomarinum sp. Ch1-1]
MDAVRKFNSFSENDGNNITIRYEDLIQNPEKTIREVCKFLNITYNHEILTPNGSESALIIKHENHMNQASEPIDTSKLANWKKSLTPELQKAALMIAHKELIQYGYENASSDNPKTLCISVLLLLSKQHRQLYDSILYTIAKTTPYTFESTYSLNDYIPKKQPSLWIIDDIPLPNPDQRKSSIVFFYI